MRRRQLPRISNINYNAKITSGHSVDGSTLGLAEKSTNPKRERETSWGEQPDKRRKLWIRPWMTRF